MTRWLEPSPVKIPASLDKLNLPRLVLESLVRRGFDELDSALAFLNPEYLNLVAYPGIDIPANILLSAIRSGLKICVWGDFDVDGQTSTALLVQVLQTLGADTSYYIPIRSQEGHGVHIPSLSSIIDNGTRLLLTCDTGITAHAAIDYARSRGLQVIITDHHDPTETLPTADALINPKLLPQDHPLAYLAGVGVAFKLAEALLSREGIALEQLLDLVALGLIADVALLKGETRSIAQLGIRALRHTNRLGLQSMAEMAGANLETLTEETIGFTFAPRLNALGRLGNANPAVELLLTNDPSRANLLVAQIEGLNAQRRLLTSQVYHAAETQLQLDPGLLAQSAIILSHPGWPGGVVGIVASRLVERYHKPAILLTESDDGMLRGSARSIDGLHITEAIATQKSLLQGFGGHPMAAGLSLSSDNLELFRKGLARAIEAQAGTGLREEPALQVDAWLGLNEITLDLAEGLEHLAPFGAGNPALILAARQVRMKSVSPVGRAGEHVRLTVEDETGTTQSMMWWGAAEEDLPEEGDKYDIAFSLRASTYRGQRQISMQFLEYRVAETGKLLEIGLPEVEVIDYRGQAEPANILTRLKQKHPGLEVLAEGVEGTNGKSRFALQGAMEFAIYTIPPSAKDLREIFRKVRPERVHLFAQSGGPQEADAFLNLLAGMCKYAINQRGGHANIHQLAAACSQTTASIRLGLEWLRAGGHISVQGEVDLELAPGSDKPDQILQNELYLGVKGILEETASFRIYFATQMKSHNLVNG